MFGLIILRDLSLQLPLLLGPPPRVLQVCHGPPGQPPTVFHLGPSRFPRLLSPLLGTACQGREGFVGQQVHLVRLDAGFLGGEVPGQAGFVDPLGEEGATEAPASLEALTELVQMLQLQEDVHLM